jgi:hypothetical protein
MLKPWVSVASISMLLIACGLDEPTRRRMVAANVNAIEEARNVQSLMAQTKKCPHELAGWSRSNEHSPLTKEPGTGGTLFWMYFVCEGDSDFVISVKYDMDDGIWVSGHETGPLEIDFGDMSERKTLEIAQSDDPAAIATRVVREQYPPNTSLERTRGE